MTREAKSARNSRDWAERRMDEAETPRKRLWRACEWLVAESWRAGPDAIDAATEMVVARIHKIRGDGR